LLYVSHIDQGGNDQDVLLALVSIGDTIIIQDKAISANYQKWNITSTASSAGLVTWGISLVISTHSFSNNDQILLILSKAGATGPQGATGTFGPTGTNYGDYVYWNTNTLPAAWAVGGANINIGSFAGQTNQQTNAVALGYEAGRTNQGTNAVAIGYLAGASAQGTSAVAIGDNSGYQNQGQYSVAVGDITGYQNQGQYAVALGYQAGNANQYRTIRKLYSYRECYRF